jgi:hypothetical protein
MKRSGILFILLFSVNLLYTQNYNKICTEGETYFKFATKYLMSFRQDSAIAVSGSQNDTLFWSYRIIKNISGDPTCYDTEYGSALGRKILKKDNGWFAFFNWMNDSIWINTQANPGDSWQLMKLGDTGYFMASLTSISVEDILGNSDSVKTITLQAKNNYGQPMEHPLNGEQIKLSRTFGFTLIYNFTTFPNDTTPLFLAGKTNPPIGYQNISFFDCYDFNIGDEFHIRETSNYNGKMIIKTLLEKSTSITGDTLTFKWDLCYFENALGGPYVDHGIVYETVSPQATGIGSVFNMQPDQFFSLTNLCNKYLQTIDNYNSRATKRFEDFRYKLSGCWQDNDYDLIRNYSEGLGMTYYRHGYWWQNQGGAWVYVVIEKELEYYVKGNETWGTPFAPDCWTLTGTDEKKNTMSINPQLIIYPNPSTSFIVIENYDKGIMSIFNTEGLKVLEMKICETNTTIDVSGLNSGVYIIKVVGEKEFRVGKFVKE